MKLHLYQLTAAGIITFSHLFYGASLHVLMFKSYTILSAFRIMSIDTILFDFKSHHIMSYHLTLYHIKTFYTTTDASSTMRDRCYSKRN